MMNPESPLQLDVFEGPLDLLLYLIRKNEIDIYHIPIQSITEQYLKYLDLMKILDLDIAGEFLAMAATLMQIKSCLLLPPEEREEVEDEEEDPRWELVRQLLEYKRYKEIAVDLHRLEAGQEDYFARRGEDVEVIPPSELPLMKVPMFELLDAFSQVLSQTRQRQLAEFEPDNFTTEDGRNRVLNRLGKTDPLDFMELFEPQESRIRIVVIFLALLELIRRQVIQVIQEKTFARIMIKKVIS